MEIIRAAKEIGYRDVRQEEMKKMGVEGWRRGGTVWAD